MAIATHAAEQRALEQAARLVERRAKAKIGEYQDAAPPFAAWASLADSTVADRERQGYPGDEPLLRTGQLRDSIGHMVRDGVAYVGSDSDIAVYQELGTVHIPPRSFLGGAAAESTDEVQEIVGGEVVSALVGRDVVGGRLSIR